MFLSQMPAASFGSIAQLPGTGDCGIKDVWNHNLHEEFQIIRQVSYIELFVMCSLNYDIAYQIITAWFTMSDRFLLA